MDHELDSPIKAVKVNQSFLIEARQVTSAVKCGAWHHFSQLHLPTDLVGQPEIEVAPTVTIGRLRHLCVEALISTNTDQGNWLALSNKVFPRAHRGSFFFVDICP